MKILTYALVLVAMLLIVPAVVVAQTVEDEAISEANDPDLGIPTVGQVVVLPRHDGSVTKGKARADALDPVVVNTDDAMGRASVKVTKIDTNRRVFVILLVSTGNPNEYTVREVNEYDYNNQGTGGNFVTKTTDPVDCDVGGATVAASGVAVKKQGANAVPWDRSVEVTLALSGC